MPTATQPRSANAAVMTPVPHQTSSTWSPGRTGKIEKGTGEAAAPSAHEMLVLVSVGCQKCGHGTGHIEPRLHGPSAPILPPGVKACGPFDGLIKVCRPFDHHRIAILASDIARLRLRGRVPGNREPSGPPDYDRWRGLQPAALQERAIRRERRRAETPCEIWKIRL